MNYLYLNLFEGYILDGKLENLFNFFYFLLNKYNSSNYYVVNVSKKCNGNLNVIFIMCIVEMYLIVVEVDIYVNGGFNVLKYINKICICVGVNLLVGVFIINIVLDERVCELCGEYVCFYDLKCIGMLKDNSYLEEYYFDLV